MQPYTLFPAAALLAAILLACGESIGSSISSYRLGKMQKAFRKHVFAGLDILRKSGLDVQVTAERYDRQHKRFGELDAQIGSVLIRFQFSDLDFAVLTSFDSGQSWHSVAVPTLQSGIDSDNEVPIRAPGKSVAENSQKEQRRVEAGIRAAVVRSVAALTLVSGIDSDNKDPIRVLAKPFAGNSQKEQLWVEARIRAVLRNEWNPVGVHPSLLPRDEYDDFIPEVASLFESGADESQIVSQLEAWELWGWHKLETDVEAKERVAKSLLSIWYDFRKGR